MGPSNSLCEHHWNVYTLEMKAFLLTWGYAVWQINGYNVDTAFIHFDWQKITWIFWHSRMCLSCGIVLVTTTASKFALLILKQKGQMISRKTFKISLSPLQRGSWKNSMGKNGVNFRSSSFFEFVSSQTNCSTSVCHIINLRIISSTHKNTSNY